MIHQSRNPMRRNWKQTGFIAFCVPQASTTHHNPAAPCATLCHPTSCRHWFHLPTCLAFFFPPAAQHWFCMALFALVCLCVHWLHVLVCSQWVHFRRVGMGSILGWSASIAVNFSYSYVCISIMCASRHMLPYGPIRTPTDREVL